MNDIHNIFIVQTLDLVFTFVHNILLYLPTYV